MQSYSREQKAALTVLGLLEEHILLYNEMEFCGSKRPELHETKVTPFVADCEKNGVPHDTLMLIIPGLSKMKPDARLKELTKLRDWARAEYKL